jgi:hypothetical protein
MRLSTWSSMHTEEILNIIQHQLCMDMSAGTEALLMYSGATAGTANDCGSCANP